MDPNKILVWVRRAKVSRVGVGGTGHYCSAGHRLHSVPARGLLVVRAGGESARAVR